MVRLNVFITFLHLKFYSPVAQDLRYNPIINSCPLSLRSVRVSRPNVINILKNEIINLLLLLPWFPLKLELAGNTTILPGRSQLVCPYSRNPFVPGIFIDMASVSESSATLTPHIPFKVVHIILGY